MFRIAGGDVMNRIYALSIKEPWISMIVNGEKTIETRTWPCPSFLYRKNLLLVGSKSPKGEFSGKAACVVTFAGNREMRKEDEAAACCEVYPRAKCWLLEDVRKVKPFPVRGRLRLYEVDDSLIEYEVMSDGQDTGMEEDKQGRGV